MDFLVLAPGSQIALVAGNFSIIGTRLEQQTITLIASDIGALNVQFDPSFNQGGDMIVFTGRAAEYSIERSGSSVIITNGIVTAAIPVGLDGALIRFEAQDGSGDSAAFDLRLDPATQSILLGDQIIAAGDPQPLEDVITFISPDTFAVPENQIAALDADIAQGPSASFSLAGEDAALFTIDPATGIVTFNAAPDFEAPADSDGDNIYDLIVTASNATSTVSQATRVSVSDVDETPPATVRRAGTASAVL